MGCMRIWLEGTDVDHLTGLDGQKRLSTGRHKWQKILYAIRFGAQDYDRNAASSHVLLILDVSIAGEQDFPTPFGNGQKLAVARRSGEPDLAPRRTQSWPIVVSVSFNSLGKHSSKV